MYSSVVVLLARLGLPRGRGRPLATKLKAVSACHKHVRQQLRLDLPRRSASGDTEAAMQRHARQVVAFWTGAPVE